MSLEQYRLEQKELLNNFLERTFYNSWRNKIELDSWRGNYCNLELYLNAKCELNCKYCYIAKFGDKYFPDPKAQEDSQIMKNLDILFNWLIKNNFKPKIELFGGDIFTRDIGFDVLDRIADFAEKNDSPIIRGLSIPSNMNFIKNERLTQRMINVKRRLFEKGIWASISASIDGKFMDDNRPNLNGKNIRNDDFYHKVFSFAKNYECGFHPMIYSGNINKWKENFIWFQEMFEKYGIDWKNIYLLEIRNIEWTAEQCAEFGDFLSFLVEWAWNKCDHSYDKFKEFLFNQRGFNILSSWLGTIGRGIGCSIQSTMCLRVGDLTFAPCHRLHYKFMESGNFVVENNEIVDINAKNIELFLAINSFKSENMPYCETCIIKNLCSSGCLGSQYEETGDPFTPIPSVCRMEFAKIASLVKAFKKIGVYNNIKVLLGKEKKINLDALEEIL